MPQQRKRALLFKAAEEVIRGPHGLSGSERLLAPDVLPDLIRVFQAREAALEQAQFLNCRTHGRRPPEDEAPVEQIALRKRVAELQRKPLTGLRRKPVADAHDLRVLPLDRFDDPLYGNGGAQKDGFVSEFPGSRQELHSARNVDAVPKRAGDNCVFH